MATDTKASEMAAMPWTLEREIEPENPYDGQPVRVYSKIFNEASEVAGKHFPQRKIWRVKALPCINKDGHANPGFTLSFGSLSEGSITAMAEDISTGMMGMEEPVKSGQRRLRVNDGSNDPFLWVDICDGTNCAWMSIHGVTPDDLRALANELEAALPVKD